MAFPVHRPRRLRRLDSLRKMVRETTLSVNDLIYPLFVVADGGDTKSEIKQIPGAYYLSGSYLIEEAKSIYALGIPAILLFSVLGTEQKDEHGSLAHSPEGPTQQAARKIKDALPELTVIADLCMCEYRLDGHCGVLKGDQIDNDATLAALQEAAISQANAGADVIAPSGMMDGMVQAIRRGLDESGHHGILTMPYSAKFASSLYRPFKQGTCSAPDVGLHKTHQLDFANLDEAIREVRLDIEEGADIVIVKPGLPSLDVIRTIKQQFAVPTAAYQVSGEYVMIRAAAENGFVGINEIMTETLMCIKRAGADMIITYFAKDFARALD